ncbi:TonB-dependent receptor [Prolixibacteraceae bacterium Z1-6]|uniref:TonB-dependent receptor n=1 Tax=Draconibacterium aestuarii TaxID=2998507 RepID=A0A9X3J6P6_9BACT|nr:TonB-dependent receptor [Prolixibacteraceae bacterium Z1-6]
MKLKTKRLTYQRNNKQLFGFLFFFCFLFIPFAGLSQHFQFKFDNTPVSGALLEVAKKTNIRIAFDDSHFEKLTLSKTIESDDIEVILNTILAGTKYVAEFKHNTWLILKPTEEDLKKKVVSKSISGIIYDSTTGERLPYASVYIWDKNRFIPSTVDGTFSAEVKEGEDAYFQIRYLGYQTLDTLVNISQTNSPLQFRLIQKSQNIETINVKGNSIEMMHIANDAGHIMFNPHRFSDLPNYGETDIFRALQFLPGISARENSAQLNIRGSSADQNLVLYDGFTLYNLDHFFGVFSALNPNVVKDIQVYRGGFDSRYGERVSGIVDITGKSGNKTNPQFYGGVNLISANLTAEIPLSKKLTLVTAGRRSYSDVYSSWLADAILADKIGQARRFPGAENVIEPKFYFGDFNTKLTWSPNEFENLSFSIYGAKDDLNSSNISEKDGYKIDTEDTNQWGNYGFGFSWKKQYGTKYFTNLQLGHSGYYNDYYNNTTFEYTDENTGQVPDFTEERMANEENNLIDYFISLQNTYSLNEINHLQFGLSAKYTEFKFYKDAENDFVYNRLNSAGFLYTAFMQDQITLNKKLVIKPGLRLNYYDQTKKMYFEPRLAANYKATERLRLKLATGRYYQFLNKSVSEQNYGYNRDFWVLADKENHPVVSSNHFIVGASFETKKLFFDVEMYYKTVDGLQEYLFFANRDKDPNTEPPLTPPEESSKFISGSGDAYGIDFLTKYENTNFTSWLAYSYSKSTQNFSLINNGENIPANYDQTHELKWNNIYTYNRWNFSTVTLYNTGHPYIATTEKDEDFNTYRTYKRLPDYFRVDLSVNYNFNIKKVNIKPGFSILNAFNTENYLDIYIREFNGPDNEFRETTLIKAQDITLNFFVNFRF